MFKELRRIILSTLVGLLVLSLVLGLFGAILYTAVNHFVVFFLAVGIPWVLFLAYQIGRDWIR